MITMILKNRKIRFLSLLIISAIITYLGAKDATSSSRLYNSLNKMNPLTFKINEMYNKKPQGEAFPHLNLKGVIIQTNESTEIQVSLGDYEKCHIGDTIHIFKSNLSKLYMTQYEIDNQMFIHLSNKAYSFVYIPTIIFLGIGIFSLVALIKEISKK